MIKNILCTFAFVICFIAAQAQMAPDFTITDSNGNGHSLYSDYLDKGKTVVLKIFFTTCPPCNRLAPNTQALYEEWGSGDADVEFFGISVRSADTDVRVNAFNSQHNITFPEAGSEGNSIDATLPYRQGDFGTYYGTPSYVVIAPNGDVTYDPGRGAANDDAWIAAIDDAISQTGAIKPGSTPIKELQSLFSSINVYPNPVIDEATIDFDIQESANIRILVMNMIGRNVDIIYQENLQTGRYSIPFTMQNKARGNYFIRIEADGVVKKTLRISKL